MSIALLAAPDTYALTQGGRMAAQFSLAGRVMSAGTCALNVMLFIGPTVEGQRITLRWNAQVVELVFRATPTEPNELPTGNGQAAYLTSLLPLLADYYPLREDFTGFRLPLPGEILPGIYFTARKPGPAYNILPFAVPIVGTTLLGMGTSVARAGADARLRERFSAYIEVWLQPIGNILDPDTFERVAAIPVEADETGLATLDVGSVLHPLLQADVPDLKNSFAMPHRLSGRAYYLAYTEAWGSPLRPGRMVRDTVRWAYWGGVDYVARAGSGFALDSLTGNTAALNGAFRSSSANALRYVAPDSLQYLSFLNTRVAVPSARLQVVLTTDFGPQPNLTDTIPAFPWGVGQKVTLPVGVAQLNLLARVPAGQKLSSYSVQVVGANNAPLSRPYRFVLDYAYRPYPRQFLYMNSLGCPETLTTFGKGSSEWQRFGELADTPLPLGYAVETGSQSDVNTALQEQTDVTTGFRPAADLRQWLDFYRSSERLLLRSDSRGWAGLPISVTARSIREAKDGEILLAHAFSFVHRYRETFFLDDEPASDPPPPPDFSTPMPITIQQVQVVRSIDDTVPQVARQLRQADIDQVRTLNTWGDHRNAGYLNQQAADDRYPTRAQAGSDTTALGNQLLVLKKRQVLAVRLKVRAIPKPPVP